MRVFLERQLRSWGLPVLASLGVVMIHTILWHGPVTALPLDQPRVTAPADRASHPGSAPLPGTPESPEPLPGRTVDPATRSPVKAPRSIFTGKVVGVLDGDTIEALHHGRGEQVRLAGIDCPEMHQPFGDSASRETSRLALGKTVTITVMETDRYGRTVAQVTLPDGSDLGTRLVRGGFAWRYDHYSSDEELARLQAEARSGRRGLWADPHPVPPWEFRRNQNRR